MEFDLDQIAGFDWDAGNEQKSRDKHGVSREEAEQVFGNFRLVMAPDIEHSGAEERFHAFGLTNQGRYLQVSFTLRGNARLIRIISARDMSRYERAHFEASEKDSDVPR